MPILLRDEGVVLKNYIFKEKDRIVDIFTKKSGKIRTIAKGARRPGSKFAVGTNPLTYGKFIFYKGKNFYYIKDIDIIKTYLFKSSFSNIHDALEILSYIDSFNPFEKRDLNIYALLMSLLKEIEKKSIPKLFYLLKFIEFSGLSPDVKKCNICKRSLIGETFYLDIKNGFSICESCIKNEKRGIIYIEKEIGFFLQNPDRKENLSKSQKDKLYSLISSYLAYHNDKK